MAPGSLAMIANLRRFEARLKQDLDVEAYEKEELVSDGRSLGLAADWGLWNVVKLLLEGEVDVNIQTGYGSVLQAAARTGELEIVESLIERGADVNAPGGLDGNALQTAVAGGHLRVAEVLLEHGADVNAQSEYYSSSFQCATADGHLEIAKVMLKYGAHLNTQNDSRLTPLHNAVENKDTAMVEFLLAQGASPDLKDLSGNTPLQLAIRNQNREAVLLLYPKTRVGLSSITASDLRRCSGTTYPCHLEMISSDATHLAFRDDSLFEELDKIAYPLALNTTELLADGTNFMDRQFDAKQML